MLFRFSAILIVLTFILSASLAARDQKHDPISGEWDVTFTIEGQSASGTFVFSLDGDKVTGTVDTAHTGPGTLSKGSWANKKLAFMLDFTKHESIDVTGGFKEDRLEGEFATEGTTGTWTATRHKTKTE